MEPPSLETRLLTSRTDMPICLIIDPDAEESSYAMSMGDGHLSDNQNTQGLSHLSEHVSLIGSRKYPGVNTHTAFLVERGGSINGVTGPDEITFACGAPIGMECSMYL